MVPRGVTCGERGGRWAWESRNSGLSRTHKSAISAPICLLASILCPLTRGCIVSVCIPPVTGNLLSFYAALSQSFCASGSCTQVPPSRATRTFEGIPQPDTGSLMKTTVIGTLKSLQFIKLNERRNVNTRYLLNGDTEGAFLP